MLIEGLGLMVTGMCVVFAFLTLLVLSMNISARFFETFADKFADDVPTPVKPKTAVIQQSDELAEIAAAIAAVKACTG